MEIPKKIYFKLRPLILPIDEILFQIPSDSSILDLGCGKGLLINNITNFKKYVGVDLNIINQKIKNIEFIKDDCLTYIEGDLGDFNTFLIIDLLHHISPEFQKAFLKNLLTKIKQGDVLIIKDINPRGLLFKFWNSFHDLIISKQLINYFNFKSFESEIDRVQFSVNSFYKRIFLYDHYFLILKKI